ncbi:cyclic nucleotide-binding domain-containing protein [Treponema pedis]|uniref:Cyclic nucleotide-binding domain-containing protein n=1 Tax=Treponema pedis TaxID=409322 RepID=A0A7S6WM65_9SPIR|nr:cyclic nucleotide-binding domain-containing protein [Treponema pedis]QOW59729.1 cyclic nucleotide-binding domain-containing protein [Treponema pedis]
MNKIEMTKDIFLNELKQTAIFSCIEDTELQNITDFSEILSYEQDETIISEGTENKGFYVLLSGKLEIVKNGKRESVKLATLKNNASFGETSLFKDETATATVNAIEPSSVLFISKEQFTAYINAHPKAGIVILTYIVFSLLQKLKNTNEELVQERNIEFSSEDWASMMSMFNPNSGDILNEHTASGQ